VALPRRRARWARGKWRPRALRDAPRHVTPICPATVCASIAIAIATSAVNTGIVWTALRRVRGGGAWVHRASGPHWLRPRG
jgi:hypothetical protein